MNTKELTNRLLLRELVDKISLLADRKDYQSQVQLFTEDGVSETFADGQLILQLKGRQAMAAAFADFNKNYDSAFHFNGQHVVDMVGEHATSTCYCTITLMGTINTTIGAVYADEYVWLDGRWLIAKRTGNFVWQDVKGS